MSGGAKKLAKLLDPEQQHDEVDHSSTVEMKLDAQYFRSKLNQGWWAQVITMCASLSVEFADEVLTGTVTTAGVERTGEDEEGDHEAGTLTSVRTGTLPGRMVRLRALNAVGTQTAISLLRHASDVTALDLSSVAIGGGGASLHELCFTTHDRFP